MVREMRSSLASSIDSSSFVWKTTCLNGSNLSYFFIGAGTSKSKHISKSILYARERALPWFCNIFVFSSNVLLMKGLMDKKICIDWRPRQCFRLKLIISEIESKHFSYHKLWCKEKGRLSTLRIACVGFGAIRRATANYIFFPIDCMTKCMETESGLETVLQLKC